MRAGHRFQCHTPEPFAGLPLDEPLVDEETWENVGKALVAADGLGAPTPYKH